MASEDCQIKSFHPGYASGFSRVHVAGTFRSACAVRGGVAMWPAGASARANSPGLAEAWSFHLCRQVSSHLVSVGWL